MRGKLWAEFRDYGELWLVVTLLIVAVVLAVLSTGWGYEPPTELSDSGRVADGARMRAATHHYLETRPCWYFHAGWDKRS